MLNYIGRRLIQIVPLMVMLSVMIFLIIQLPPGDYLTIYIQRLEMAGTDVSDAEIATLRRLYNLDRPMYQQYLLWIRNILFRWDFGRSLQWDRPVSELIGERLPMTVVVSIVTLVFTYVVSITIGIYSATNQYTVGDYFFSFLAFIGISVPGFLVALVVMYWVFALTGIAVTGLFSEEYIRASWSWAKVLDGLRHIWLPTLIIGLSGTAGLTRTMRGLLLDELQQAYVTTARAKGVSERQLLFKYPVRLAINPMVSTIGWLLPSIVSGQTLVAIVLNMPTTGPLLLQALLAQDMYLAGGFLLMTSSLTVIGSLISDILLGILDPRIRFGGITEG
jgi:peptide/nickel transport system permease protein